MQQAIIDIGSNSMRLTVYETQGQEFRALFKDKVMAGLAGYVQDGLMTQAGIDRACEGLMQFRSTLTALGIEREIHAFATASLRNIVNTDDAVAQIHRRTGFQIDVISGQEEALLGYAGVMKELNVEDGAFMDVGGASTEFTVFAGGEVLFSRSYRVGSLKLYAQCVKKILPGQGSLERIDQAIRQEIPQEQFLGFAPQRRIYCTGGSARSLLKLSKRMGLVASGSNAIPASALEELGRALCAGDKAAADLILQADPERIHTIVPGYMIFSYAAKGFRTGELIVCKYGVREGYLSQKVLA